VLEHTSLSSPIQSIFSDCIAVWIQGGKLGRAIAEGEPPPELLRFESFAFR
jgi:hypothetical protein